MIKILIAEDDQITQKLLSKAIEEFGYVPFVSPNGKHAYETLKANPDFKLLITDMVMPEMGGRELIKKIQEDSSLNNLPIIIISGFVGVKKMSAILKMGADFFQTKPINMDDLFDNIKKCLNR